MVTSAILSFGNTDECKFAICTPNEYCYNHWRPRWKFEKTAGFAPDYRKWHWGTRTVETISKDLGEW